MRAQRMEELLRRCRGAFKLAMIDQQNELNRGTKVDFQDTIDQIDAVLDRSPAGGKVDAGVSNTPAARRPGSSPGPGTTPLGEYEEIQERVEKKGGCSDWPCDYACLRRGRCDHE